MRERVDVGSRAARLLIDANNKDGNVRRLYRWPWTRLLHRGRVWTVASTSILSNFFDISWNAHTSLYVYILFRYPAGILGSLPTSKYRTRSTQSPVCLHTTFRMDNFVRLFYMPLRFKYMYSHCSEVNRYIMYITVKCTFLGIHSHPWHLLHVESVCSCITHNTHNILPTNSYTPPMMLWQGRRFTPLRHIIEPNYY